MTLDELADEVEHLILKACGPAKFIPVRAQWIGLRGEVLAEGPLKPIFTGENTFYGSTTADRSGTFSHLLLISESGYESKATMRLNTKSILIGATLDAEVTITYHDDNGKEQNNGSIWLG